MTKGLKWLGAFIALGALAWCAGLVWFAATIPDTVTDADTHTDAIVVLTGGSERIETGLKLLADGRAEKLYISGVGGSAKPDQLLARAASDPELSARISTGTAANTPGNALETTAWARSRHVGSIRLVTAGYHMRRSLLELHSAMPELRIVPHPVFPATVKSDWWRWPGTASLIAREYSKYAITWMWQWLGLEDDLPRSRTAAFAEQLFPSAEAKSDRPSP